MKLLPPLAEDVDRGAVRPAGGADAFAAPAAVLAGFAPWVDGVRRHADALVARASGEGMPPSEAAAEIVRALAPALAGQDEAAAPWRGPLQARLNRLAGQSDAAGWENFLGALHRSAAAPLADAGMPPARWAAVTSWARERFAAARSAARLDDAAAELSTRAGAPAELAETLVGWVRHLAACLRGAAPEDWPEAFAAGWAAGVLPRAEAEPDEWREVIDAIEAGLAQAAPNLLGWKAGAILHRLAESAPHFAWAGSIGRGEDALAARLDPLAARRGMAWKPLLRGAVAAVLAGEAGTLRRLAFQGDARFGGASAEEWAAFAGEMVEACRAYGAPASSEALAMVLAGAAEALALGEARRAADLALARAAAEFFRRGPRRGAGSISEADQAEQQLVFLADLAVRARSVYPHRAAAHAALRRSFHAWFAAAPQPGALPWGDSGAALAASWQGALREPLGSSPRLLAALDAALAALRPLESAERAGRSAPADDESATQAAALRLWEAGGMNGREGRLLRRLALDAAAPAPVVPDAFAEAWEKSRRDWLPAERAAVLDRLRGIVAGLENPAVSARLHGLLDEAATAAEPPAPSAGVAPGAATKSSPEVAPPIPEPPSPPATEPAEFFLTRDEASQAASKAAANPSDKAGPGEAALEPASAVEEGSRSKEEAPAVFPLPLAAEAPSAAAEVKTPAAATPSPVVLEPTTAKGADEPVAPPRDEVDLFLASAAKPPAAAPRVSPAPFASRRSGPPPGALLSFSPAMFAPPMTRLVDPRPPKPASREKPAAAPPPPAIEAAASGLIGAPEPRPSAAPEQSSPAAEGPPPPAAPGFSETVGVPSDGSSAEAGGQSRKRTVSWPPGLADAPPPVVRPDFRVTPVVASRETVLLPLGDVPLPPSNSVPGPAAAAPPPVAAEPEPAEPAPPPEPAWPTFPPPIFPPRFVLTEQVFAEPSLDWRTRSRSLAGRLLESAHDSAVRRAARWRGMEPGALGDRLAALSVIFADGFAPAEWSGHLDPDATEGWVAWLDSQPPELWRAAEDWLVALGTEAAVPALGFTGRLRLLDYLGQWREFHRQAAMVRAVAQALAATGEWDALGTAGVLLASLGRGFGPAAVWRLHRLALEQFDVPPDAAALAARAGLTPDQARCLFNWLESLETAGTVFNQGVRLRKWLGGEKAASDLPAADDREALFLFLALASACAGSKPAFAAQLRLWAAGTLPEVESEAGRATWSEIFARLPVRLPPEGLPAVSAEWDAMQRALESADRLLDMVAGLENFGANLRDALGDALDGDAHALARRQLPASLLLIARETTAPLAPAESGRLPTPLRFTEDEAWRALTRIPPAADRALAEMLRGGAPDTPEASLWVLFRRLASERVALETAFGEVSSFRPPRVGELPLTTAALERQWIASPSPAGELAAQAARRECLATWLHPGGSAHAPAAPLPAGSAPLDELAHRQQQLFTRLAGSLKLPTPMRERFQILVRRLPALTAAARLRAAFPNATASPAAALATVVADALEENRHCQLASEDAVRLDEAVRDLLSREEAAALANAIAPGGSTFGLGEPTGPDPSTWRAWRLTQIVRG